VSAPSTPPPPWREDPRDTPIIGRNIATMDAEILAAMGNRHPFSLELPLRWHTAIHVGCTRIPSPYYVGNYRGTPLPHIASYEVRFGGFRGSKAVDVAAHLAAFEASLQTAIRRHDAVITDSSAATASRVNNILETVAMHYAWWLRIHPFADGNGRTARLLANWVLGRYWQPLLLPGRPPVDRDALVAATTPAIATGDHRALVILFRRTLMQVRRAAARSRP
jgi:hypothetical protein